MTVLGPRTVISMKNRGNHRYGEPKTRAISPAIGKAERMEQIVPVKTNFHRGSSLTLRRMSTSREFGGSNGFPSSLEDSFMRFLGWSLIQQDFPADKTLGPIKSQGRSDEKRARTARNHKPATRKGGPSFPHKIRAVIFA